MSFNLNSSNQNKNYTNQSNVHERIKKMSSVNSSSKSNTSSNSYQRSKNSSNFNPKISNIAEPTNSVFDREDSLYDAQSLGMQTPFRLDQMNFDDDFPNQTIQDLNLETNSKLIQNSMLIDDDSNNRYSFIDLEYIKKSSKNQNEPRMISNKSKNNDMFIDLKDTSIDEILLIADNSNSARLNEYSVSKFNSNSNHFKRSNSKSPSKIPIPLSRTSPNNKNIQIDQNSKKVLNKNLDTSDQLEYFSEFRRESSNNDNNKNNNQNQFVDDSFSNELASINTENQNLKNNTKSPHKSNLEKLKERINSINLNEWEKNSEIFTTPQSDLVLNENDQNSSNKGAFKLYTSGTDLVNDISDSIKADKNSNQKNFNKSTKTSISPFISIDKPNVPIPNKNLAKKNSNSNNNESSHSKRGPIKKYRSGSTSNLTLENKNINKENISNRTKQNSERIRPATHTEITYSLDSDESTLIDNLINDPEKLKKRLRQSKIDKEQLNQLQENYIRLLEQYAEAENFIDEFRLNGQFINSKGKGTLFTNNLKSPSNTEQLHELNKNNYKLESIYSSTNTIYSNQQNNLQNRSSDKNSLNNSKQILTTPEQAINRNQKTLSISTTPSVEGHNQNFDSSENFKKYQSSQSTVYVIPTNNNRASIVPFSTDSAKEESDYQNNQEIISLPSEEQNLVIDQTSRLGILVQIKLLEDKMESFLTLVHEDQLSKSEQRQVYDSITNDYQTLIKNYQEVRKNDSSGILPDELDMDVDLNKELGKMKDLLNDIVHKMNDNLIDEPTSESSQDKRSSNDSINLSFFDNQGEAMKDQYNRLLDVFNNESHSQNITTQGSDKTNLKKESSKENILTAILNNRNSTESNLTSKQEQNSKRNNIQLQNAINNEALKEQQIKNNQQMNNNNNSNNDKHEIFSNRNNLLNSTFDKNRSMNNSLNKKLSRISGSREDEIDNENENDDTYIDEDKHYEKSIEQSQSYQIDETYDQNETPTNNRKLKLVRMSNDTETTSSETERLDQKNKKKNSRINYKTNYFENKMNDIVDDTSHNDDSYFDTKNLKKTNMKNIKKSNQEIKMKSIIKLASKKRNEEKSTKKTYSDTEDDKTMSISNSPKYKQYQQSVENVKKSTSNNEFQKNNLNNQKFKMEKKSISTNNLHQIESNKRIEEETKMKLNSNKRQTDFRKLPVAKAYEGSESEEDLESVIMNREQRREKAQQIFEQNEANYKTNETKIDQLKNNQKLNNRVSTKKEQDSMDTEERNEKAFVSMKNQRKNVEIIEDLSQGTSEIESIIERKRALAKSTKRDLMKKLAEEVEFLKKEILKKNSDKFSSNSSTSSANENERKKHRSNFISNNENEATAIDSQNSFNITEIPKITKHGIKTEDNLKNENEEKPKSKKEPKIIFIHVPESNSNKAKNQNPIINKKVLVLNNQPINQKLSNKFVYLINEKNNKNKYKENEDYYSDDIEEHQSKASVVEHHDNATSTESIDSDSTITNDSSLSEQKLRKELVDDKKLTYLIKNNKIDNLNKNFRYSSVSNLATIKKNIFIENDMSDTEPNPKIIYKQRIDSKKKIPVYYRNERVYESSNDIHSIRDHSTKSLNDINCQMNNKNSLRVQKQRKVSDRSDREDLINAKSHKKYSSTYTIPVIKNYNMQKQIPIIIKAPSTTNLKKQFLFDSKGCLVCLPVNKQHLSNTIPISIIPYPLSEFGSNLALEQNVEDESILNNNQVRSSKNQMKDYSTNDHVYKKISRNSSCQNINNNKDKISIPINDESNQQKKSRKVRYYIREYTDISTVSDNEIIYRRKENLAGKSEISSDNKSSYIHYSNESNNKENRLDSNHSDMINDDVDKLIRRALDYANCLNKKTVQIKKKLRQNINYKIST